MRWRTVQPRAAPGERERTAGPSRPAEVNRSSFQRRSCGTRPLRGLRQSSLTASLPLVATSEGREGPAVRSRSPGAARGWTVRHRISSVSQFARHLVPLTMMAPAFPMSADTIFGYESQVLKLLFAEGRSEVKRNSSKRPWLVRIPPRTEPFCKQERTGG